MRSAYCYTAGPGLKSSQQKARRLLELMDPELSLGQKKNLQTGNYAWQPGMFDGLIAQITTDVAKWVPTEAEPPYGYNTKDANEMKVWQQRRRAALSWVKSIACHKFAKGLYMLHSEIFKESIGAGTDVHKILHQYNAKRHFMESVTIREELATLLQPVHAGEGDVVDKFAFIIHVLLESVYVFFGSQVRATADVKPVARFKDREDLAKTYYLCGVVLISVRNLVKKRKNAKYLEALSHFTVDGDAAVR